MAQQLGSATNNNFVDKRRGRGFLVNPVVGDYRNQNTLDTYLFGLSPTSYSQLRLRQMTFNDKIMAARIGQDNAGIK